MKVNQLCHGCIVIGLNPISLLEIFSRHFFNFGFQFNLHKFIGLKCNLPHPNCPTGQLRCVRTFWTYMGYASQSSSIKHNSTNVATIISTFFCRRFRLIIRRLLGEHQFLQFLDVIVNKLLIGLLLLDGQIRLMLGQFLDLRHLKSDG